MTSKSPRVILYDLETSHNLAAVFGLANQDWINPENIIQERYIVSFAWKVLGEAKVHAVSVLDDPKWFAIDPHCDNYVVKELHKVLSSADVIIAHNGDAYDIKFAETRMLYHELPPLPPITKIDTLKIAKSRFMFNSNKLDYLGKFLKVGEKAHTSPGLWLRVLAGASGAVEEMVKYNKQDVLLLERVFLKLRPYCADHINRQLFGQHAGCPRCGSLQVQSRGVHRAISRTYQRFVCTACRGWFRLVKPEGKAASLKVL